MKTVYEKHHSSSDAQVLYADAMMIQHPWDLWNNDGTPKPWTPLIREVLEKVLKANPEHPGANHYYIHVMEPSPFASNALASASILGKTNPGLSHLVHMPSHIYLRTGNYQSAIAVNINAINSYQKSISLYKPVTNADFLYLIHNLHMLTNNAMLAANKKISEGAAFETQKSISEGYFSILAPMGSYISYIYMTPILHYIRFGNWNEILLQPEPEHAQVFAKIIYHFGRGMAYANLSRFAESKYELQQMQQLMKDSSLLVPFTPFSPAIDGAIIAENLLLGTISLKEKRVSEAIKAFLNAASIEENMVYNEPRDWMLNPKHYLGKAYLENNDGLNAEIIFRKDLNYNNENAWALMGLYKALLMQNKNSKAAKILSRFKKTLSKSDIQITSAVF